MRAWWSWSGLSEVGQAAVEAVGAGAGAAEGEHADLAQPGAADGGEGDAADEERAGDGVERRQAGADRAAASARSPSAAGARPRRRGAPGAAAGGAPPADAAPPVPPAPPRGVRRRRGRCRVRRSGSRCPARCRPAVPATPRVTTTRGDRPASAWSVLLSSGGLVGQRADDVVERQRVELLAQHRGVDVDPQPGDRRWWPGRPSRSESGLGSIELDAELRRAPGRPRRAARGLGVSGRRRRSRRGRTRTPGRRWSSRRARSGRPACPGLPSLVLVLVDDDALERDQAAEQGDVAERRRGRCVTTLPSVTTSGSTRCSPRSRPARRASGGRPGAPPRAGSSGSSAAVVSPPVIAWPNCSSSVRAGRPGQPRQAGTPGVRRRRPVLAARGAVADLAVGREARPGRRSCPRVGAGAHHHAGERLVGLLLLAGRAGWSSPAPGSRSRRAAGGSPSCSTKVFRPSPTGSPGHSQLAAAQRAAGVGLDLGVGELDLELRVRRDRDGRLVDLDLHRGRPRRGAVAAERRASSAAGAAPADTGQHGAGERGGRDASGTRSRFMLRLRG